MKRNIIKSTFLILAASVLLFTSCEDLDEGTKGVLGSDSYYADAFSLDAGLRGIQGNLHWATWSLDYQSIGTGADDLTTRPGSNKWVIREADLFEKTGGNSWYTNVWDSYYRVILHCNSFIEKAHPAGVDEKIVNAAQADARMVRGMVYFRLASVFGDIPMPLSDVPDLELSLTPKREVMAQVIKDLEFAVEWAVNERDNDALIIDGHASKTAAKAFLAKTYMQLTGWPYNETEHWAKVKSLTDEIINAGVYTLMDDFSKNFQMPTQNNAEIIYAHMCSKEAWPITLQSRVYGLRWENWVDMFMEWTFFNNFPQGWRKKYTCTDDTIGNYSPVHNNLVKVWDHPFVTKYSYGTVKKDENGVPYPEYEHTWQTSNDMPAMRYAEVLLMNAEANARIGSMTDAVEKLNWVRRRAYANGAMTQDSVAKLPEKFWMTANPAIDATTSDDVIAEIVAERGWEFVGEIGINRWLDLMRLEMVGTVNDMRDANELEMIGNPHDQKTWWCPIPDAEKVLNPNLDPS